MSRHTRQDKIVNEYIKEKVGVTSIVDKMVESCFRWFSYVWRRSVEALVRRVDQMKGNLAVICRAKPLTMI